MLSSEPGEAAKVRNLGFTLPPNGGKEAGKPRQKLRLASGRTLLRAWKRKVCSWLKFSAQTLLLEVGCAASECCDSLGGVLPPAVYGPWLRFTPPAPSHDSHPQMGLLCLWVQLGLAAPGREWRRHPLLVLWP